MKNAPYLAKERIFHSLHPTFVPRPRPENKKKAGRENYAARGAALGAPLTATGGVGNIPTFYGLRP